jgi:lipopolysaccharide assembly outer membrane protein LptD (OstA)
VLEFRQDNGTQDRTSWATKHKFSYQHSDDWRLLGHLAVTTSSVTGGAQDHEYAEFALGAAYRPVRNDRWNTLVMYRYVHDSGAGGQISSNGSTLDYAQKSHVFSLDATYQLTDKLSLGGKIGGRIGEIRDLTAAGAWVRSDALLAIARIDYEFTPSWSAVAEYRVLKSNTAKNRTQGGLIAVSKKVKDNVKITVGYNATDFSDDLTVQDYTARGWFLNLTVIF